MEEEIMESRYYVNRCSAAYKIQLYDHTLRYRKLNIVLSNYGLYWIYILVNINYVISVVVEHDFSKVSTKQMC